MKTIGTFKIHFEYIFILIVMHISLIAQAITQAQANACALQSDGKIIAAGYAVENDINQFCIARYITSGDLDITYNSTGTITTAIGTNAQALGLVIQPFDDKTVVAGYAVQNNNSQVAIARYTIDGILDTTFNSTGIVTTTIGDGATATAIAIDSNNKLVIVGVTNQLGQQQFLLIRYNSDGSKDTTFGNEGVVSTQIDNSARASAIAIQSDGKIVVGGFSSDGINGEQFTLARYATDGNLDTTFGMNGIVITDIGSQSHIKSIVIQSDGAIVVSGFTDNNYCIARYLTNGTLDTSFNFTGIIVKAFGSQAQINAIAIDSNNNIIGTGFTDNKLLIARYISSGSLDTAFNGTGENTLFFENTNVANALALPLNDNIVVAGFADNDYLVARYQSSNGILDTTWGNNGIVNKPTGQTSGLISRIWDQKTIGTNGGTFTSGSWQDRTLNQLTTSDENIVLANNQFTLGPGSYDILITAPAYRVGNHQMRLQNVTDNITALWGSTAFSNTSIGSMTSSYINGQLLVSKLTSFTVQHMCSSTESNDGFGIAAGFSAAEIYTFVTITPH